jgi:hypothetical protein
VYLLGTGLETLPAGKPTARGYESCQPKIGQNDFFI